MSLGGRLHQEEVAELCRQGKVCPTGRTPGTVLPDVGQVPCKAPRRLLGPPSPAHAAACPGPHHSRGPSPLPGGCWGLQSSREKPLPGWWLKEPLSWALQGTPGCSGSWAGGTSMPCARTSGVVGPSTTSDSNTTGCRVAWWVSPLPSPCPRGGHGTQWAAPLHHGW